MAVLGRGPGRRAHHLGLAGCRGPGVGGIPPAIRVRRGPPSRSAAGSTGGRGARSGLRAALGAAADPAASKGRSDAAVTSVTSVTAPTAVSAPRREQETTAGSSPWADQADQAGRPVRAALVVRGARAARQVLRLHQVGLVRSATEGPRGWVGQVDGVRVAADYSAHRWGAGTARYRAAATRPGLLLAGTSPARHPPDRPDRRGRSAAGCDQACPADSWVAAEWCVRRRRGPYPRLGRRWHAAGWATVRLVVALRRRRCRGSARFLPRWVTGAVPSVGVRPREYGRYGATAAQIPPYPDR